MNKIVSYIKSYVSIDVFLLVLGALFIVPAINDFAFYMNGGDYSKILPDWLLFVFTSISIIIVCLYLFRFFYKNKNLKLCLTVLGVVVLLIIVNLITTLINPNVIISHVSVKMHFLPHWKEYFDVESPIDVKVKVVFIMEYTIILLYSFSAIFVLPKQILNIKIIYLLVYATYLLLTISIVYSLIKETSNYGLFLEELFHPTGEVSRLPDYAIISIFGHRNIHALVLMIVFIASIIAFSMDRKVWHAAVAVFVMIYMLFTYSKTAIALTYAGGLGYFYIFNICSIRENKRRSIIALLIITGLLLTSTITILVGYNVSPSFKKVLDPIFTYFGTVSTREAIWETTLEILGQSWLFTGHGFGVVEYVFKDVGPLTIGELVPHEHSWFYSLLAKGGILLVTVYILMLSYFVYLLFKNLKKSPLVFLTLLLSMIMIFIHSFMDASTYVLLIVLAVLNMFIEAHNDEANKSFK